MLGFMTTVTVAACAVPEDEYDFIESESNNRRIPNNKPLKNPLGKSQTFSTAGYVDLTTAFSENLGTNGRTCISCHLPDQGWSVSADEVRDLFYKTKGKAPIFRTNDGSNSPHADVSTFSKRLEAYSMLINRGTIRVGIGIPANAEFELIDVDDPYGFASATELSLFRRPLPSANLTMIRQVMWDGRVVGAPLAGALSDQANGATQGHAARPEPLTQEVRDEIVNFEVGLFNAQIMVNGNFDDDDDDDKDHRRIGRTTAEGADGGAETLADQAIVNSRFNLFDAWATSKRESRRAVFRGQELFNTKTRPNGGGACRGCHSAENVGTNANGTFFNIGVSDGSRRAPDQPLYTLRRISTGEIVTTTDPGRALITGLWSDLNRFKTPSLRALGARAPYFHGGSAATLADVVTFYEEALGFDFTDQEEADLVAFMAAL
jgi:hypothetical protein